MTQDEALQEIEKHRVAIDGLDEQLVALLNERAGHSLAIRALKPAAKMELYDPGREDKIFKRLEEMNTGPMHAADVHEVYATILKVMKAIRVDE